MPELPDVEVLRRYVKATALHQKIEEVEVHSPEMLYGVSARTLRTQLKGNRFEITDRYGKHLFIGLNDGQWLTLHFGMTGSLAYFKILRKVPSYTRLLITFSNGFHLAYDSQRKLGMIGLIKDTSAFVLLKGLGPDALDSDLAVSDLKRLFAGKRASIKSTLMDQRVIAGIGNIYSDEILFQSRIHPEARAGELDNETTKTLLRAIKHVLRIAIDRQADPERLPASWLLTSRQPNGICPKCGTHLARTQLAGRTAYFCMNCQHRKV